MIKYAVSYSESVTSARHFHNYSLHPTPEEAVAVRRSWNPEEVLYIYLVQENGLMWCIGKDEPSNAP